MKWTKEGRLSNFGAGVTTFLAVVIGWVFSVLRMFLLRSIFLKGMAGLNGITFSRGLGNTIYASTMRDYGIDFFGAMHLTNLNAFEAIKVLVPGMFIVFMLPNVQQIMASYKPVLEYA